jgi:hypothetical protein
VELLGSGFSDGDEYDAGIGTGGGGFGVAGLRRSYPNLFVHDIFEGPDDNTSDDDDDDDDDDENDRRGHKHQEETGLVLRRLNLGYSGGAAPRLAIDRRSVYPATLVLSHTAVVAHVSVHGLNRFEQDLNDVLAGSTGIADEDDGDDEEEDDENFLRRRDTGGAATSNGQQQQQQQQLSLRHRMQHYLRVESDVLVAYSAVKPRALLPALVGSGLVGSGILSTPSLGRILVCWFGNAGEGIVASSDNGDGGGGATSVTNAAAVNLGVLRGRRPPPRALRPRAFLRRPAP